MAYYVPQPKSQRSAYHEPHLTHRNNNCTMATGAVGMDYDTKGAKKPWPGDLRHNQPDQVLGTDLNDLSIAWHHYGEKLEIGRDGWPGVINALEEGRCVMLPGQSRFLVGLPSQSQNVPHSILLHPRGLREAVGDTIYTMDPWGQPAKWQYVSRRVLKRYWESLRYAYGLTRRRSP